jgi:hypothetical protein
LALGDQPSDRRILVGETPLGLVGPVALAVGPLIDLFDTLIRGLQLLAQTQDGAFQRTDG